MSALPLLLLLALVLAVALRHLLVTPPSRLAHQLRIAGGGGLIAAGVGLLFLRQFFLAIPVAMAGVMMLRRHARMRTAGPSGQNSSVRSAGLEMVLDHDTGEMQGRVLAGRHEGRSLSELSLEGLLEVADDVRDDAESLRLLESYLDRVHPGWRDDVHADQTRGKSAATRYGRNEHEGSL